MKKASSSVKLYLVSPFNMICFVLFFIGNVPVNRKCVNSGSHPSSKLFLRFADDDLDLLYIPLKN